MTSWLASLVLLSCCLSWAQSHGGGDTTPLQAPATETVDYEGDRGQSEERPKLDMEAELLALRDMVVEQRVELWHTVARVTAAEGLVESLQKEKAAMEARLTVAERLVEELQMENDAQAMELGVAQQKLGILTHQLKASEGYIEQLQKQQEGQLKAVQELQNTNIASKVAFSASLLESGEGNTGTTGIYIQLIYKNVFTNIGNHYNQITGYFTAPVRGVYFFRFTGHIAHSESSMLIRLFKNGLPIVSSGDRATTVSTDAEDNVSNGIVLPLEVGDLISLQSSGNVWDDEYHRTTFSGFLLFPL